VAQAKRRGKQCEAPVPGMCALCSFLITFVYMDIVGPSPIPNFTPDFAVDNLSPVICMSSVQLRSQLELMCV
jgi:hypothetical protein